jgi:cyclopropane fatty-acyl-phospholipid synthase-like methyltransferase
MTSEVAPSGAIKTMQLYSHIDRIWNELKELGFPQDDNAAKIDVEIMNKFDCYNYGGAAGATASCAVLGLTEKSIVLDVGSGLGGPARCVASFSGCTVKGIELQADLAVLANSLSRRCGIEERASFIVGDVLDDRASLGEPSSYDAAMSWLVILHLPLSTRRSAFARVFDLLKPGGRMYVEDFFRIPEDGGGCFGEDECMLLREEVYVPDGDLPSRASYIKMLCDVGFEVDFQDVTAEWTKFTSERCEAWRNGKDRHQRVHNFETWDALDRFYSAIVQLFMGGNLGGVRLVLTKPC